MSNDIIEPEPTPEMIAVIEAMRAMSDEQRYYIMSEFCLACGNLDQRCQCWNDA